MVSFSGFIFSSFIGFKSLVSLILLAVIPVAVQTNEGERVEGTLLSIQDSTLVMEVGSKERTFAFEELASLEPTGSSQESGPAWMVQLTGGSKITAESLVSENEQLKIQPRDQDLITIPMNQLRSIRFRRGSTETDSQWLGWLEQDQRSDLLVIRREGERLDPQQGLIKGLNPKTVAFDLEGTPIDAPIERLEGVIFANSNPATTASEIVVLDQYGSEWRATGMQADVEDGSIRVDLGANRTHRIKLNQVSLIRWSSGLVLLAGVTPAASTFDAAIQTGVPSTLLDSFFSASTINENDLVMHSGASIEYRVDQGFSRFVGSVERHPDAKSGGRVAVRVELDGVEKWNQMVSDQQPSGFEIPLENARRVVIRVDDGGDGEVGDTVQVHRPRLIK
jgi:hypothetical protein